MLWEKNQAGKEIGFFRKWGNLQFLKGMDRKGCNIEYRLEEGKSHLAISVKGIATSRVAVPGVLEEARGTVWLEQNDHGEHSRRWEGMGRKSVLEHCMQIGRAHV